jgi:intraflagellar transport protein 140
MAALEELRSRMPGVQLAFYVNMKTIEAIHRALDIPFTNRPTDNRLNGFNRLGGGEGGGGNEEEEEGGFVEEEVIDDMFPGDNV